MAKEDNKGTILAGASTYRTWHAMFVAECMSEKLCKCIDGSAILPGPDPRQTIHRATTTTSDTTTGAVETKSHSDRLIKKTALEVWLGEKNTCKVGFEPKLATVGLVSRPNQLIRKFFNQTISKPVH